MKRENFSSKRKGKREYLNRALAWKLIKGLYGYCGLKVDVARIRHVAVRRLIR